MSCFTPDCRVFTRADLDKPGRTKMVKENQNQIEGNNVGLVHNMNT